jgi:hypothetical protein
VFWQMSTQWRVGMNGVIGLDYVALDKVMDFCTVADKKTCFEKIRILESEQLKIIHGD